MNCHACETENNPNRRYCAQCGEFLITPCARCSFANQVKDRFCGGCGVPLQATESDPPRAQREQLAEVGDLLQAPDLYAALGNEVGRFQQALAAATTGRS
jgi:hypothetical protein